MDRFGTAYKKRQRRKKKTFVKITREDIEKAMKEYKGGITYITEEDVRKRRQNDDNCDFNNNGDHRKEVDKHLTNNE